ncbi:hypothetical protein IHV25_00965 [Phaeovibrio sulfidiphilus]|uniref:Lipoprotein n=1 Tax=Phaeovibrio sulfidiphilus TaxID=1220600 RepID=A0A8J7CNS3_9PROT|nr:hypothetical protein [Phaeovibrio sulfidiphilus]MBE1236227.1 hypothetical protein [Phaeovibrio sulfidiphilus]
MKRLLLPVVCLVLTLSACEDSEEGAREQQAIASKAAMMQNRAAQQYSARNSLQYWGRYQASSVRDDPYVVHLDRDTTFRFVPRDGATITGIYQWDLSGSNVTLKDDRDRIIARFFVGENYIRRIDKGPWEGRILRKVMFHRPQP